MARPVTKIIAPPIPWKTRKTMSKRTDGAAAESSDATVNRATPALNTFFIPKMSDILPNGTVNMAAVSRNDVGTQLNKMASAENSSPIAGSAMLTAELMKGVRKFANVETSSAAIRIELSVRPCSMLNAHQSIFRAPFRWSENAFFNSDVPGTVQVLPLAPSSGSNHDEHHLESLACHLDPIRGQNDGSWKKRYTEGDVLLFAISANKLCSIGNFSKSSVEILRRTTSVSATTVAVRFPSSEK